ncbi:MAG TPA: hypothetical protein VJK03_05075 [Candidatus Nanoarchaeia archaeon]|nr:hypothetical protein [Candidatus Nanoarchaeia archaeon]
MFFGKKSKKEEAHCPSCRAGIQNKFSFCPYCGESLIDEAQELQDFGMLGRGDVADEEMIQHAFASNLGITERLLGSLVNSLIKNIDVRFQEVDAPEVKNIPNGIRIQIGSPQQKKKGKKIVNRVLTAEQLERMNALPRAEAKSQIRRLSDKILCELNTPGIISPEDVIFSKLESGYEVKVITKSKVYVNSIPINLPLKGFALHDKGLVVEFAA